jgi:predicted DNA-binding transcriptional regulator AlpA
MKEAESLKNDRLLRKKEAAAMLAYSLRSVDRLVAAGKLTRAKILGGIRFRLSEVQFLMNGGNHDFQG